MCARVHCSLCRFIWIIASYTTALFVCISTLAPSADHSTTSLWPFMSAPLFAYFMIVAPVECCCSLDFFFFFFLNYLLVNLSFFVSSLCVCRAIQAPLVPRQALQGFWLPLHPHQPQDGPTGVAGGPAHRPDHPATLPAAAH